MPVVQTQTPIWSIWAAAMDNAFQLQAFVLSTGNKCAPSAGSGLTVNVASGTVVVNGNTTTTAISAGSVTPTSPVNNPRRDIVFISSAGTLTLTQGTEGPAPVPPTLPGGACLIAVLFIPTGAVDYSAGFPNSGIEDMRFIFAYDISTGVPSFHSLGTGAAQSAAGNHTTPAMTATVAGHVPTPPNNTTTFLRGDATFASPPAATATVTGYVPTPPNDATKYLRGDATWTTAQQGHGQSASASLGSNVTTASTTFVDATGLSVTITTTGGDVIVYFHCTVENQTVEHVYVTMAKDGTNVTGDTSGLVGQHCDTANDFYNLSFVYRDAAPTSASHTYKIQWRVQVTGTATMHSAPQASIVVVEQTR